MASGRSKSYAMRWSLYGQLGGKLFQYSLDSGESWASGKARVFPWVTKLAVVSEGEHTALFLCQVWVLQEALSEVRTSSQ